MPVPISFFSMPAATTALAGVFRVDPDHFHAESFRLVANELFKFIERPAVQVGALLFPKPAPITNTAKLFKCNRRVAGFLGELDDVPADDMIHVSLKAPFPARQPFQGAPRRAATRLCLFLLERGAYFGVAVADMIRMPATEENLTLTIGDGSQHIDTAVYAHHGIVRLGDGFHFTFEGNRQVDITFAYQQPGITQFPVRYIVLKLWTTVISDTFQSTINSPNAQSLTRKAEVPTTESPLKRDCGRIKGNRFVQILFGCSGRCIFACYLSDAGYGDLRRQAKRFGRFIAKLLKFYHIAYFTALKGNTTDRITSFSPSHNGTDCRIERDINLDQRCSYNFRHMGILTMLAGIIKFGGSAFPCRVYAAGECA